MIVPISALVAHGVASDRARLADLLRRDPAIAVIGEAATVDQVVAMTKRQQPDVVAIGIELPTGGGLAAARRIMVEAPTPIVIVADDRDIDVQLSVSALRAGALATVPKPWSSRQPVSELEKERFVSTIKALSQVKVIHHRHERRLSVAPPRWPASRKGSPVRVVAVAASTGGPGALQELLSALPAGFPAPILVVQHMAPGFVEGLAATLNSMCPLNVRIALHGEPLLPRTVFMAPDELHLGVCERSHIMLSKDAPLSGFRPSASILFESVGKAFGAAAAHVILTGMGRDGVAGLLIAREHGGRVLAQDSASSIVFGMPGEAVNAGIVDSILPPAAIANELVVLTRA